MKTEFDTQIITPSSVSPSRWKPCRSGLVNFYKFDYEEFSYHDGKMLVRGNNGAGKTRFLALQLPFLLDGDISSQRVEPDGSLSKKMEWNLLMDKYQDRTGYTWIEFVRVDSEGNESFITLGCGLHATEGRGLTGRWYFITQKRIGQDLFLLNEARQPLRKDRLEQALGQDGRVYTTVASYRKAVDDALFGLGPQRYEAMINLLIQLRQPQLSKEFHEERFSSALSDALAPLPLSLISDIAEAFRGLDRERDEIGQYERAVAAMDSFLTDYRAYARIAARKKAEGVRGSQSAYESDMRTLREIEERAENLHQQQTENTVSLEQTNTELASVHAEIQTLRDSPEMKGAREIERLNADFLKAQKDENLRGEESARAAKRVLNGEKHQQEVQAQEKNSAKDYDRHRSLSLQVVQKMKTSKVLETLLAPREIPPPASFSVEWQAEWQDRKRDADSIKIIWEQWGALRGKWSAARTRREDLEAEKYNAQEVLGEIQTAAATALGDLKNKITSWRLSLVELSPPSLDLLLQELDAWSEKPEENFPLEKAVQSALRTLTEQLAKEETEILNSLAQLEKDAQELLKRHEELASGVHFPPQSSSSRDFASRTDRAGAAFWELFDFDKNLSQAERAGLEAALEASGLLDAWVTPDGDILSEGVLDASLVASTASEQTSRAHLGKKMRFIEDAAVKVPREIAEKILRNLGAEAGAGSNWVSTDGAYALGSLQGHWHKKEAQHIGASARESTRLRLLLETENHLALVTASQNECRNRLRHIELRRNVADTEASALPHSSLYRTELNRVAAQTLQIEKTQRNLLMAEQVENEARARFDDEENHLNKVAHELNLDHWKSEPLHLITLLEEIRHQLRSLESVTDLWRSRTHLVEQAEENVHEMREDQRRLAELSLEAQRQTLAAKTALDTQQKTMGKAALEVQKIFAAAQKRAKGLEQLREDRQKHSTTLAGELGIATGQLNERKIQVQEKMQARQIQVELFKEFSRTSLLRTAYPELTEMEAPAEWSITRTVEIARRLETLSVEDSAKIQDWDRLQKGMYSRVSNLEQHLLELDLTPSVSQQNDVIIVDVSFQNQIHPIGALRHRFSSEIESRSQILNSHEQEILENHLIDEISVQLHHHLHQAELWLVDVNRELNERPTSSGMRLRFKWALREDAPESVSAVRRLLLRAGETWSNDDRAFIARFLQGQIQEVRTSDQGGTWEENLTKAFDYRRWHLFSIERQQNGQWKKLTKKTHGTGSGGEKAIALTMPQFAAAAAHYRGARPDCPRLILLDEAFVGVDKEMRSKSLGLLQVFDLDLVMTSESEWGCYPTLPGIAIFQLVSGEGIDAVHVRRFTWNGRKRIETPQNSYIPFAPKITDSEALQTDFFSLPQEPVAVEDI